MTKKKVLIVEDEMIVAMDIRNALRKMDFDITGMASSYDEVIQSISKSRPDIIIMDIHLENSIDGIEIATEIQKIDNIPIIYLTAFTDDDTIKRAVRTNPVGYLNKPFNRDEIKSNIHLGLYKANEANRVEVDSNCIRLGYGYYFDMPNEYLFYTNIPIKLGVKERQLIKILIEARGAIVSFDELEHLIWPDEPVSQSALRTLIYRTRSKLEHKIIETIPAFGCRLTPKY